MKIDTPLLIFALLCIAIYAIFIAAGFIEIFPWGFIDLALSVSLRFSSIKLGWTVCAMQRMTTTRKIFTSNRITGASYHLTHCSRG